MLNGCTPSLTAHSRVEARVHTCLMPACSILWKLVLVALTTKDSQGKQVVLLYWGKKRKQHQWGMGGLKAMQLALGVPQRS